ncbi:MAG: GNAT family N-acetyltransferase [Candidatus Acidiferrales bacterium]|jgi:RimJ/RimL family protein N-acetyltransferase
MTQLIETARTRLTPWHSDDWRALHAIAREPEVMRYITNGAPWTETQTQEFVARQLRHFSERTYCLWKLNVKSDGASESDRNVDGLCGIQPLVETDEIEIGWWLAQRHWGKGIASEAAHAAARDAFERVGLDRLVAVAVKENAASLRIMEKLGMAYERNIIHRGVPVVLYSVTKSHWLTLS